MKKLSVFAVWALVGMFAATSWGIPTGADVTSPDLVDIQVLYGIPPGANGEGTWWSDVEDQEVEPGALYGQEWDLEAFYWDDSALNLSVIGGYDFVNGQGGYLSGDLFLDIDSNAKYGPNALGTGGPGTTTDLFGYEYVVDLNFQTLTWNAYALASGNVLDLVQVGWNDHANPWLFNPARTENAGNLVLASGSILYETGLGDFGGLVGGAHNAFTVNLDWVPVPSATDVIGHYTYGCGNDNLMGQWTLPPDRQVPDTATTALLLGVALVGLQGLRRKIVR